MQSMDVGKRIFLRRLRKSYVNGAVRRLRSRHRHWAWCILGRKFDVILSMRRSLGASFTWGHGSLECNTPTYSKFELRGLTPAHLRYAAATFGASAL